MTKISTVPKMMSCPTLSVKVGTRKVTFLFDKPRDTGRDSNFLVGVLLIVMEISYSFFLSFSRSSSLRSTFIVVSRCSAFACALFSIKAKSLFNCS